MANKKETTGIHILGKIYTSKKEILTDFPFVRDKVVEYVREARLTKVGEASHVFSGEGFTFVVLLAESHISIHTWPELNCVTADVYVCNLENENSDQARELFDKVVELFEPNKVERKELKR